MFKRSFIGLAIVALSFISLTITGCERKKRLTGNQLDFRVSPPAATLVKGSTVTLTVVAGSAEVNPTWSVSGPGTLSTSIGRTVVFSSDQLGDAVVTAIHDGVAASAQIAVVTSLAAAEDRFDVYTEGFFPNNPELTATGFGIFVGPDNTAGADEDSASEETTGYTPQGVKYFRLTARRAAGINSFAFLAAQVAGTKDLSAFSGGTLKLSVRTTPELGLGPNLRVEVNDTNSTQGVNINSYGFSNLDSGWQEISIPASAFTSQTINLATIKNAFAIALQNIPNATTFIVDVDAIRWEK